MLFIYPLKKDKKTFDADKEELGFSSKTKTTQQETIIDVPLGKMSEEQKQEAAEFEFDLRSKFCQAIFRIFFANHNPILPSSESR